jgi:hypothetical protein
LTAWKLGNELDSASFIKFVGEEEYKKIVNFILRYLSEVDVPVKRLVAPVQRTWWITNVLEEPLSSSEME